MLCGTVNTYFYRCLLRSTDIVSYISRYNLNLELKYTYLKRKTNKHYSTNLLDLV